VSEQPLTAEQIAAREIKLHRTPGHDCRAPIMHSVVATLDAARAGVPGDEGPHWHDVPGVGTIWWDAAGKIVAGPEDD